MRVHVVSGSTRRGHRRSARGQIKLGIDLAAASRTQNGVRSCVVAELKRPGSGCDLVCAFAAHGVLGCLDAALETRISCRKAIALTERVPDGVADGPAGQSPLLLPGLVTFNCKMFGLRSEFRTVGDMRDGRLTTVLYINKRGRLVVPPNIPYTPIEFWVRPDMNARKRQSLWLELAKTLAREMKTLGVSGFLPLCPESRMFAPGNGAGSMRSSGTPSFSRSRTIAKGATLISVDGSVRPHDLASSALSRPIQRSS